MIDKATLVKQWLEAAEPTAKLIGCSPSAIVAQAVLETGWGASCIGNNIFGIKADKSWHGAKRLVRTREVYNGQAVMVDDWFRDYPSVADSFEDHFRFLQENSRYAAVFDPNDSFSDEEYFRRMAAAGYATDPNYANALVQVQAAVNYFAGHVPAQPTTPVYLTVGDTGHMVMELQKRLNKRFDAMLDEDGEYGSLTFIAVKNWQARNGLYPDGIAGPKTLASLGLA